MELEVIYLKRGIYHSRKFAEVDENKGHNLFITTVAKMKKNKEETLVCLRSMDDEGNFYLINSERT